MLSEFPVAANNSAFHRYVHSFPQAPCGPPWSKNLSGYFLFGSNPGGLTRNPCTSSLFAPLNVNDSNGCMSIVDKSASFMWVICFGSGSVRTCNQISFGAPIDCRVKYKLSVPLQTKSSLCSRAPSVVGTASVDSAKQL